MFSRWGAEDRKAGLDVTLEMLSQQSGLLDNMTTSVNERSSRTLLSWSRAKTASRRGRWKCSRASSKCQAFPQACAMIWLLLNVWLKCSTYRKTNKQTKLLEGENKPFVLTYVTKVREESMMSILLMFMKLHLGEQHGHVNTPEVVYLLILCTPMFF